MDKAIPKDPIVRRAFELIWAIGPEVGEYLYRRSLERLSGIRHVDAKHSEGDLRSVIVTEADLKVHNAVVEEFKNDPVTIIAEEGPEIKENAAYRIVLDDLDGTYNASRGVLGRSAVSLAIDKDSKPLAGIWYNPYFEEMVFAETESGAWRSRRGEEGVKIGKFVSPTALADARIIIGSGIKQDNPRSKLWNPPMATVMQKCLAPINLESTAVSLMDVALGRVEGFVITGNKSWDLWASRAIFSELSMPYAFFSECWGRRLDEEELNHCDLEKSIFGFVCASNNELFSELVRILQKG